MTLIGLRSVTPQTHQRIIKRLNITLLHFESYVCAQTMHLTNKMELDTLKYTFAIDLRPCALDWSNRPQKVLLGQRQCLSQCSECSIKSWNHGSPLRMLPGKLNTHTSRSAALSRPAISGEFAAHQDIKVAKRLSSPSVPSTSTDIQKKHMHSLRFRGFRESQLALEDLQR